MTEYHKIQSIFKRDMTSKRKTLIEGEHTPPELAQWLVDLAERCKRQNPVDTDFSTTH